MSDSLPLCATHSGWHTTAWLPGSEPMWVLYYNESLPELNVKELASIHVRFQFEGECHHFSCISIIILHFNPHCPARITCLLAKLLK